MAHVLSFTDGTTTITCTNANGYQVGTYTPAAPSSSVSLVEPIGADGGEIANADLRNVTDSPATLYVIGSSKTDLQAKINALETLMDTARRRQLLKAGPVVYVQLKVDGESYTWRSEILDARLEIVDGSLNGPWASSTVEARLYMTRRYFWERTTEATALASTGITNDSSNVATLSTITGVIPAPAKIDIENDSGGSLAWRYFHIANDAFNGFTSGQHHLSGGTYSWTGSSAHTTVGVESAISSTILDKCAGQYFHVIGGFSSIATGCYVKLGLYVKVSSVYQLVAEGNEIYNQYGAELIDFGVWQLPPRGSEATDGMIFMFTVYAESTGSATMDFLQLTPAHDYLKIRQRDFSLGDGGSVVFDDATGQGYMDAGATQYANIIKEGGQLRVWPGRTNKIMVLFDESGSAYNDTRATNLVVTYRPRRLTV